LSTSKPETVPLRIHRLLLDPHCHQRSLEVFGSIREERSQRRWHFIFRRKSAVLLEQQ